MTPMELRTDGETARQLLAAETLEEFAGMNGSIPRPVFEEAARVALERRPADKTELLRLRAGALLERVGPEMRAELGRGARLPKRLLALALGAAAFLLGLVVEGFGTTGGVVNLLSPALLLLLAWSTVIYILSLRELLAAGSRSAQSSFWSRAVRNWCLKRAERHPQLLRALYAAKLSESFSGVWRWEIRFAFHAAAVLFAAGMLAGLALRGIGTAYVVGWESTWFAGRPDLVSAFLRFTYGLAPSFGLDLPPLPDASQTALLNLAEGMDPLQREAAPWLLRIMLLAAAAVLIPRTILAGATLLRAKREAASVPVPLVSEGVFRTALEWSRTRGNARGLVLAVNPAVAELASEPSFIEALALRFSVPAEHWSIEISDPWGTPEADLAPSAGTPVLFAVDLLDIPEETHGRWIRHTLSAGVRPLGLLGFEARLALRYGEGSERLERRRSLWQAFAQAEGLQYLQPHDILSPSA